MPASRSPATPNISPSARDTPRVVMMLAGTGERPLRVALATTHLPLKDVPAALTIDGMVETLRIIDHDLRAAFRHRRAAHPRDRPQSACGRKRLSRAARKST